MQLQHYLRVLLHGWWISALTTLIALLIALIAAFFATPVYRATAHFLITPNSKLLSGLDVVNSLTALEKKTIAANSGRIFESTTVAMKAAKALRIDPTTLSSYTVATTILPDASILAVSVNGPDPYTVAAMANAVGQEGIYYISNMYHVYNINFMNTARVPSDRLYPKPQRKVTIAMVLGLVAGGVITILRDLIRGSGQILGKQGGIAATASDPRQRTVHTFLATHLQSSPERVSMALVEFDGLENQLAKLPTPAVRDVEHHIIAVARGVLRGRDLFTPWRGNRFLVGMADVSVVEAQRTTERLQTALQQPLEFNRSGMRVTFAPHITVFNARSGEQADALLQRVEAKFEPKQAPIASSSNIASVPDMV